MNELDPRGAVDDCWNRIGVWGSTRPRCDRLDQIIHCRRCIVFAEAAAQLRDRNVPPDYAEIWRGHYAATSTAQAAASDTTSLLIFRLGSEWLALPLTVIDEVIDPITIHPLSHENIGPIEGLASVRGRLRPCLGVASLLELEPAAQQRSTRRTCYPRMVVIRRNDTVSVFAVDEVLGLQRVRPSDLLPPPGTLSRSLQHFSLGVLNLGDKRVGLLDDGLLFRALTGTSHT